MVPISRLAAFQAVVLCRRAIATATVAVSLVWGAVLVGQAGARPDAAQALALLRHGRYAEARQSYERLAAQDPVTAAIGLARCDDAVGALDGAIRSLSAAAKGHPRAADLHAEWAALEFERGAYDSAQVHVDEALRDDPDQPQARYWQAELHRVAGRLDRANEAYGWLIAYYNARQDSLSDPEAFRWIGLGAAQYARWNRNSAQFHFLIETLYPDALARDSTFWRAHLEEALLFIEKYNRPDGLDELRLVLAINPNAAEALAAHAWIALQAFDLDSVRVYVDRALAINPRLVRAFQLRADVEMLTSGPRAAAATLERARALDPADEETLGRLAAVYGVMDGLADGAGRRMGAVRSEAERRNPHCGAFFASLARSLDLMQLVPEAAHYDEEARRRMPQLLDVPGHLGMLALRLAEEDRARDLLKEAFEIDPYNVRVNNSLKVLDLLRDYGRLETPHFTVRFDRGRDSLLASYASRWLEQEVYPEVTRDFGYTPGGRTLVEIFSGHGGTSGHSWFSARMIGLPFVGTVGASTGKMIGLSSPANGASYNWGRVLKHEFVHVVNLQQTNFRIPRWYTEGLAVAHEGSGTSLVWQAVLVHRVAADSLFDLNTINLGFLRPSSGEDWALAYYQAQLYVSYMTQTYGSDAPLRMIAAYSDHLDTRAALKRSFGVTQEAFEAEYRRYLKDVAKGITARGPAPSVVNLKSDSLVRVLERRAAEDSNDGSVLVRLARLAADRDDLDDAGRWASEAIHVNVMDPEMHGLLGRSLAHRERHAEAIDEYAAAAQLQPDKSAWRIAEARECVAAGRAARARELLSEVLARDPHDADARKLFDTLGR
jgi:tetratricopeptide (TPR) repeat protein